MTSKGKGKNKKPTQMGENRTGTAMAPVQSKKTEEGALQANITEDGFVDLHAAVVETYAAMGEPIGTMPLPASMKGVVGAAKDLLTGQKQTILMDKIGERIAFERTGTRLYEQLLVKFDAFGTWPGGPTREDLVRHHDEELRHFTILVEAMREIGGDPTAMTPCADVTAVESTGILTVIADSRTTLAQCTHAIQVAELVDRDAWNLLCELTDALGHTELSGRFRHCCEEEKRHLRDVRAWNRAFAMKEAGASPTTTTTTTRPRSAA